MQTTMRQIAGKLHWGIRNSLSRNRKKALIWWRTYQRVTRPKQALGFVSAKPVMLFGCQRSGTTMTIKALSKSKHVELFNEDNPAAFDAHCELRPLPRLEHLIASSDAQIVLFKPISDTYRAHTLLESFANVKGLFIFRHFDDVVNSIKRTPTVINTIQRSFDLYLAHTSAKTQEVITNAMKFANTLESRYALYWFIQNAFFVDFSLHENTSIFLLEYEAVVKNPQPYFVQICQFLEIPFQAELIAHINPHSIGKMSKPDIAPEIRVICQEMYESLVSLT